MCSEIFSMVCAAADTNPTRKRGRLTSVASLARFEVARFGAVARRDSEDCRGFRGLSLAGASGYSGVSAVKPDSATSKLARRVRAKQAPSYVMPPLSRRSFLHRTAAAMLAAGAGWAGLA